MRPNLIKQDLITTPGMSNSSKMFTQHVRTHKSEPGVPLSLTIKKQNLKKTCAHRSIFSCLAVTGGVAVQRIFQENLILRMRIMQCYGSL